VGPHDHPAVGQPASNDFTGGQIAAPIAKQVIQAALAAG
jgi:hypothetical protein